MINRCRIYKLNSLRADNNVIDGDVDEFDKESNETHQRKSNSCCNCNLLKLFPVWFCTSLDKSDGILPKLSQRFNCLCYLIHCCFNFYLSLVEVNQAILA